MIWSLTFNVVIAAFNTASFLRDPNPLFFFLFGVNCACIGASWVHHRRDSLP